MAELIDTSATRDSEADRQMRRLLKAWLQTKDPREPMGAIVLAQYDDGFSVQYLGSEQIDADELVRRVVYIADEMREAAGPIGYYP